MKALLVVILIAAASITAWSAWTHHCSDLPDGQWEKTCVEHAPTPTTTRRR